LLLQLQRLKSLALKNMWYMPLDHPQKGEVTNYQQEATSISTGRTDTPLTSKQGKCYRRTSRHKQGARAKQPQDSPQDCYFKAKQ
jgi:hypothetical protein